MALGSVANGRYALLMYVESASRQGDWYRVTLERHQHTFGCDCPKWTFQSQDIAHRSCKHTQFVTSLLRPAQGRLPGQDGSRRRYTPPLADVDETTPDPGSDHPYVHAIQTQFPGLHGQWLVDERRGMISGDSYRIIQVGLESGNGDLLQASIAFAEAHQRTVQEQVDEIAIRLGYTISLELAQRRNISIPIRPPSHFSLPRSPARTHDQATRQRAGAERRRRDYLPALDPTIGLPSIRFDDILRVAGTPAAGHTPAERAEGTLRLLLGDDLYTQLSTDGYLDVPSVHFADQKRVYRLRRDPRHLADKRVRIFEEANGRMAYVKDFCIVRAESNIPEADCFLSKWLGLLSDERRTLAVVGVHNIFQPYSDDYGQQLKETRLPVWPSQQAAAI